MCRRIHNVSCLPRALPMSSSVWYRINSWKFIEHTKLVISQSVQLQGTFCRLGPGFLPRSLFSGTTCLLPCTWHAKLQNSMKNRTFFYRKYKYIYFLNFVLLHSRSHDCLVTILTRLGRDSREIVNRFSAEEMQQSFSSKLWTSFGALEKV